MEWLVLGWGVVGELVPLTPASNLGYAFTAGGVGVLGLWVARWQRRRRVEPEGRDASLTELVGGEQ